MPETRIYPGCCMSMNCGRTECEGCECKPILDEFNQWKKDHAAKCADPVWSQNVYRATK